MHKIRVEDTNFYSKKSIRIGEKLFDLSKPKIMGIVNCTPDSFYAPSRQESLEAVLQQVEAQIQAGVDILDIGGYSSRPGAKNISTSEEIQRTVPVIAEIRARFPELIISIDTFRGAVAEAALEAGANLINDISAGELDPDLFRVLEQHKCPYVLMHMRGTPQSMQQETDYASLFKEISYFFSEKIKQLRSIGVTDVIIDPGFGFAKTTEQNFELLKHLHDFKFLNLPVLVGLSRKSMIYKTLDISPEEALNGTSILHAFALLNGASMLRVHDVKEAKQAVMLLGMMNYE